MLVIGQALTNSAAIPILLDGMMCCRSARPDDFPILERTGQVLAPLSRLFCRSPVRAPRGSAPRCRAAYRSSGLN